MMAENNPKAFGGFRTRYLPALLKQEFLKQRCDDQTAEHLAHEVAKIIGTLDDIEKGTVKTLVYVSREQIKKLVSAVLDSVKNKEGVPPANDRKDSKDKKAKKANGSLKKIVCKALSEKVRDSADIAIFGRMVADEHTLMVEGAGLFSHALSTHRVSNEIDFFSAVDDYKIHVEEEGAGHIGDLEFNSACYYRYVGLNLDLLWDNDHLQHFGPQERSGVLASFIHSAILAVPPARKNSMFGFNPPSFVLAVLRRGQPLSLVNAFEEPVRSENGYLEPSKKKMLGHWENLKELYGLEVEYEAQLPPETLQNLEKALSEKGV